MASTAMTGPAGPKQRGGTLAARRLPESSAPESVIPPGSPASPNASPLSPLRRGPAVLSASRAGERRGEPSGAVLSGSPGCAARDDVSSFVCPSAEVCLSGGPIMALTRHSGLAGRAAPSVPPRVTATLLRASATLLRAPGAVARGPRRAGRAVTVTRRALYG